jgi:uncharacterized protein
MLRLVEKEMSFLAKLCMKKNTLLAKLAKHFGDLHQNVPSVLERAVLGAKSLLELEDLPMPFLATRKTKAQDARTQGLQPLAAFILSKCCKEQTATSSLLCSTKHLHGCKSPLEAAKQFCAHQLGDMQTEKALEGAVNILADDFAHSPEIKKASRDLFNIKSGALVSKLKRGVAKETLDRAMLNYTNYEKPLWQIQPHQWLAIQRGEKNVLSLKFIFNASAKSRFCVKMARNAFGANIYCASHSGAGAKPAKAGAAVPSAGARETWGFLCGRAFLDGLERLLLPSRCRQIRHLLQEASFAAAFETYKVALQDKLMSPPPPLASPESSCIVGLDPGYKNGIKLAVVRSAKLDVVHTDVLFLHGHHREKGVRELRTLVRKYSVELIAVGNGTASMETEQLVRDALDDPSLATEPSSCAKCGYVIVDEAGASVYSASKLAEMELPGMDATLRSPPPPPLPPFSR